MQTAKLITRAKKRIRAAIVRFQIKRVDDKQREVVENLSWAVDMRIFAQRYFTEESNANKARRDALQGELDAITKELA